MIDISTGRYWDKPWSLVDGCTPCSPGCSHCWSAGLTHRFGDAELTYRDPSNEAARSRYRLPEAPRFTGKIVTHPERLDIPLKRRKPTVYAVWNDIAHEDITWGFFGSVIGTIAECPQHTFLLLTKRAERLAGFMAGMCAEWRTLPNLYCGLTVCTQQEADKKIPIFLQVPGKKFISHEPALETIDYGPQLKEICCLIAGGETGPGARPMNMAWVQSIRDQCKGADIPFFFKNWGDYQKGWLPKEDWAVKKRLLDGRTHDDLPWVTP
jgi:protein gp37